MKIHFDLDEIYVRLPQNGILTLLAESKKFEPGYDSRRMKKTFPLTLVRVQPPKVDQRLVGLGGGMRRREEGRRMH